MKKYKYILLDWDGNIAKTLHIWPDAINTALQERNIHLSKTECIKVCGGTVDYLTSHRLLSEAESMEVLRQATEIVKTQLSEIELYPGAADTLRELKESGMKLALITSSFHRVIEPLLIRFDLSQLFDIVICSDHVTNIKPHAEPLQKALAHLGGSPEHALMVGDTDKDILAGHNTGVDSALFYPYEHQEVYRFEDLMHHKPTYVISEFKDVVKIANGSYS